jgi:hypothetical protein
MRWCRARYTLPVMTLPTGVRCKRTLLVLNPQLGSADLFANTLLLRVLDCRLYLLIRIFTCVECR